MARRFVECCQMFEHHFIVRGNDVTAHARHYLSGLLGTQRRKNLERIQSDVAESNYQGMQQFVSDSPWDHAAVLGQIAEVAEETLGGDDDTALYVDESSFVKKGKHSVGVKRQYCGRLGKLENCQVGVFLSLGRGMRTALVDLRLFLPEEWADDEQRCRRAKIPEDRRRHRTKTELALEMIEAARARGSTHRWIGGDEVYGNNHAFTAALEDAGETFLMDVARSTPVWLEDPTPRSAPARASRTGRPPSRLRPAAQTACSIATLVEESFRANCRALEIRPSAKGIMQAEIWVREVWLWDQQQQRSRRRMLVVRAEADGTFKYSLSNAPAATTWERLAYMQAQRFWIERCFQDAKSELGMAQYEVRGWIGWHHHMTLVALALLFLTRERCHCESTTPLLSARDVVELLAVYLPRRSRDPAEVLRQMHARHLARQRDIDRRLLHDCSAAKPKIKTLTK